ncbi:hypothetical protein V8E54_005866 [Elaphomyces granulatus]
MRIPPTNFYLSRPRLRILSKIPGLLGLSMIILIPALKRTFHSAYVDRRQHVNSSILDKDEARIQRDPKQHFAPTPEPTSTSAEPSSRRTESSETAAEDVCDISFGDPGTVPGEIAASKLAAATTAIPGDMPILKIDGPQSTSAEPTETTSRTESSETAIKDIELGNFSRPKKSGDITPSEFAATAPVAAEDITIPDGINGIEPSNTRVDIADVSGNAL